MNENNKLGHVMVDLETMGRGFNAVICSIGAVEFDLNTGKLGREFFCKVDIQSGLNKGLKVNGDTIEWWLMQSESARIAIATGDGIDLQQMLQKFNFFIEELGCNTVQIWGNGISFDIVILTESYKACGYLKEPWNFRNERDVRTLVSFAPEIKANYPNTGVEHNPIDDCKFQIGYCNAIWSRLVLLRFQYKK